MAALKDSADPDMLSLLGEADWAVSPSNLVQEQCEEWDTFLSLEEWEEEDESDQDMGFDLFNGGGSHHSLQPQSASFAACKAEEEADYSDEDMGFSLLMTMVITPLLPTLASLWLVALPLALLLFHRGARSNPILQQAVPLPPRRPHELHLPLRLLLRICVSRQNPSSLVDNPQRTSVAEVPVQLPPGSPSVLVANCNQRDSNPLCRPNNPCNNNSNNNHSQILPKF